MPSQKKTSIYSVPEGYERMGLDTRYAITTTEPYRIYSLISGRNLKVSQNNSGYEQVSFAGRTWPLARVIAAHLFKRDLKDKSWEVDHIQSYSRTHNIKANLQAVPKGLNARKKSEHLGHVYEYLDQLPSDCPLRIVSYNDVPINNILCDRLRMDFYDTITGSIRVIKVNRVNRKRAISTVIGGKFMNIYLDSWKCRYGPRIPTAPLTEEQEDEQIDEIREQHREHIDEGAEEQVEERSDATQEQEEQEEEQEEQEQEQEQEQQDEEELEAGGERGGGGAGRAGGGGGSGAAGVAAGARPAAGAASGGGVGGG
jgi:hypothetical protein